KRRPVRVSPFTGPPPYRMVVPGCWRTPAAARAVPAGLVVTRMGRGAPRTQPRRKSTLTQPGGEAHAAPQSAARGWPRTGVARTAARTAAEMARVIGSLREGAGGYGARIDWQCRYRCDGRTGFAVVRANTASPKSPACASRAGRAHLAGSPHPARKAGDPAAEFIVNSAAGSAGESPGRSADGDGEGRIDGGAE